jgi:hypothetical protein
MGTNISEGEEDSSFGTMNDVHFHLRQADVSSFFSGVNEDSSEQKAKGDKVSAVTTANLSQISVDSSQTSRINSSDVCIQVLLVWYVPSIRD